MIKTNIKVILFIISFTLFSRVFGDTGDITIQQNLSTPIINEVTTLKTDNTQTQSISDQTKNNSILTEEEVIDLNSAPSNISSSSSTSKLSEQTPTTLDKELADKKKQLNSIVDDTKQEKDIKAIENAIKEVQIKKELNESFLNTIKTEVSTIKEDILKNQDNLKKLDEEAKKSSEAKIKINELEKTINSLKDKLAKKEILLKDLQDESDKNELLNIRYQNTLNQYTKIKKEMDDQVSDEINQKMKILYFFLIASFFIYIIKLYLSKRLGKEYERGFLYFDFIFAIFFILFLISFFFYLYTQLYILLFFISGYLIYINAPIIASFVGSILVFRKYTLGDIIKQGDDKGKVVRISPIFTTIRVINDDGIITNHNVNIPNAILVREKVDVIKNPSIIDHNFHIIVHLKEVDNLFKFVDEIRDNIILKTLTNRLNNIDSLDDDIFKIVYDQTHFDRVKIRFFWRATSTTNRKLERKILGYVKYHIDMMEQRKKDKGIPIVENSDDDDDD